MAVVRMFDTSEPPVGSVMPRQNDVSRVKRPGSHAFFWAGVP